MTSMTLRTYLVALVGLATVPAFAQDVQPVTRAQVRAELVALENAGYDPAHSKGPDYPENLQAAERKLAANKSDAGQYGPSTNGTSESGTR